jgi:hypothetical protein
MLGVPGAVHPQALAAGSAGQPNPPDSRTPPGGGLTGRDLAVGEVTRVRSSP